MITPESYNAACALILGFFVIVPAIVCAVSR